MVSKIMVRGLLAAAFVAAAVAAQANVFHMPSGQTSLQFVSVGAPNNPPDPATGSLYGSVSYTYYMGKYDVTTAQYVAFLNSVAKQGDPYGLYYSSMAGVGSGGGYGCGIVQSGAPGSYSYSVATAYQNFPVNWVTWGDAARFSNWLQNGQPSGAEGNGTTETGAYTLNGATSNAALMAVTRNPGATYFIPAENEWYKASYYDPTLNGGAGGYWTYPTKSNTAPINTLPDTGNHANFYDYYGTGNQGYTDPTNLLTPVGSFILSPGPFGTYDMGGDVFQWEEDDFSNLRRDRGGSWGYPSYELTSSDHNDVNPTIESLSVGFRVASIEPEPSSLALLLAGGSCLLAYVWRRRRQAA